LNVYPEKLREIVNTLGADWEIVSFTNAGMGWAAELVLGRRNFTLHSERGWVDIYDDGYSNESAVGCSTDSREIVQIIRSLLDTQH